MVGVSKDQNNVRTLFETSQVHQVFYSGSRDSGSFMLIGSHCSPFCEGHKESEDQALVVRLEGRLLVIPPAGAKPPRHPEALIGDTDVNMSATNQFVFEEAVQYLDSTTDDANLALPDKKAKLAAARECLRQLQAFKTANEKTGAGDSDTKDLLSAIENKTVFMDNSGGPVVSVPDAVTGRAARP